jgi:hypothetical protein
MENESREVELLIAIGRIEAEVRFVRESMDRIEKKVDLQDAELREVKLEVAELKTQRNSNKNVIAILLSLAAIATSVVNVFLK